MKRQTGAVGGERCIIRSGTVIYEDAVLGNDIQTAHNVVIREGVRIGDGCAFGSGCDLQMGARLGRNVRLQIRVVISENAELGNDIFIAPGVVFTGGRFMTGALEAAGRMSYEEAAALERGNWDKPSVVVADDVRIGANSVILAGVRLGKGCVVGAGSVVWKDVPAGLARGRPVYFIEDSSEPAAAETAALRQVHNDRNS